MQLKKSTQSIHPISTILHQNQIDKSGWSTMLKNSKQKFELKKNSMNWFNEKQNGGMIWEVKKQTT